MARVRKGFVVMSQTIDGKIVEKSFPESTVDHWSSKGWKVKPATAPTTTTPAAKAPAQPKES